MSKNILDLRFGVKRPDGYISTVWRLYATRNGDVYLSSSLRGVVKYSFHQSGICRNAFTNEHIEKHGMPKSMTDRAMSKWRRNPTPLNSNEASMVAMIAFPTDFLSREQKTERKKVTWVDAAPSGRATYFELAYTSGSENKIRSLLSSGENRKLLKYGRLSDNEALIAMYYHGDWENKDINSPASDESIFPNLLFSSNDPDDTGRPIRIVIESIPKDGDALIMQELGGYKLDK